MVEAICESEEDNPSQSMFTLCKVSFSVQNYFIIASQEETEAQMSCTC